jgi:hypothetical protein
VHQRVKVESQVRKQTARPEERPVTTQFSDEDVDVDEPPSLPTKSRTRTKATPAAPSAAKPRATSTTNRTDSQKAQPLFLQSSGDEGETQDYEPPEPEQSVAAEDEEMGDEEDGFTHTMQSNTMEPGRRSQKAKTPGRKKARVAIVDDDSDDGGFKGFGRRKGR